MGKLVTIVVLGETIINTVVSELLRQSRFAKKPNLLCRDEEELQPNYKFGPCDMCHLEPAEFQNGNQHDDVRWSLCFATVAHDNDEAFCYSIGACISLNAYQRDQNWKVHSAEVFHLIKF